MSRNKPIAVDIRATIAPLPILHNRRADTPAAEAATAFARLAETRDGAVFAGTFDGSSPWERHPNGDELVQVLAGETKLTIMTDDGPTTLLMKAGMLTVVPQGAWHKFDAPDGVTVLTMTPEPTDHTSAEDPRQA
jgi:quercetin dioxygenase-like cupin family protein